MKWIVLILLLIQTRFAFGQIINGDFEVWDTTYIDTYSPYLNSIYGAPNPFKGKANHWKNLTLFGVSQTTDSYSGNYSLILYNWYDAGNGQITYHDTISSRPLYLQGYYKYTKGEPHPSAQGEATVTLTRFNGVANDTIATGSFLFDTIASFTSFQLTLNYVSLLVPDSINIYIVNTAPGSNFNGFVCNLLYLDNLTLSNSPLGIENLNAVESPVVVFPNPSSNELNIQRPSTQLFQFTLYNSLGSKVIDKMLTAKKSVIDLSSFSDGIYFYRLCDNKITTGKIIKQ